MLGPEDHVPSQRKLAALARIAGWRRAGPSASSAPASRWRAARVAATKLVDRGVTGIICASDVAGAGHDPRGPPAGLSVPGDVSVVGFDDSAFMTCTDPPLTTVRQPIETMGQAAVDLLVTQIERRRRACATSCCSSPSWWCAAPPRPPPAG